MIAFRSQKRLGNAQIGLLIRGLIQNFRRTFPPLSHAESPPQNLPTIPFIYPQFLKAFPQNFSTDISPTKYPAKEKKMSERRGEERISIKRTPIDCCFTFKIISKFCLLRMPVVQKLLFCTWRRV